MMHKLKGYRPKTESNTLKHSISHGKNGRKLIPVFKNMVALFMSIILCGGSLFQVPFALAENLTNSSIGDSSLVTEGASGLATSSVDDVFTADITVGGAATPCIFKVTKDDATGYEAQIGDGSNVAISTSATGDLIIPASVTNTTNGTTYTVTSLGAYCFQYCSALTSTGLESNSTVTSLGTYCFQHCFHLISTGFESNSTVKSLGDYCFQSTALTSTGLEVNSTVTSLGQACFYGCSALTSTGLESNSTVTSLGAHCFQDCNHLTSTGLATNTTLTSLSQACFALCSALTSTGLEYNSTVTSLGDGCFSSCSALTSTGLEYNSTVTSLGDGCFYFCSHLTSTGLEHNSTVTSLGDDCFRSCTRLTSTSLATNTALTSLGNYCFQGCIRLTSTGLATNTALTSLGAYCFQGCTSLTSTGLATNTALTSLGNYYFQGCTSLTSTELATNTALTSLGAYCFQGCTSLTSTGLATNTALTSLGNYCFQGCTSLTSTELATNTALTSLGAYCFQGCTSLTSTGLATNTALTSLGAYCFQGCTSLTSTGLATNTALTSLDTYCFQGCTSLISVGLETNSTLTSLGVGCFYGNAALTGDLVIPSQITSIGGSAFLATSFTRICLLGRVLPKLGTKAFNFKGGQATLYVPAAFVGGNSITDGTYTYTTADGTLVYKDPVDISPATLSAVIDQTYTGKVIIPSPVVTFDGATLVKDTDYTLAYADNTNVGTASITITGIGNYNGTAAMTFNIAAADIASASIAPISNQVWTGSAITPLPVVTLNGAILVKDTDYTLAYTNNTNVGTATITLSGSGNFTGTTSTTFSIVGRDISHAEVAPISDATYTGSAITPLPVVTYGATTLTAGSDYTLAYSGNTSVGSATVTITGTGHYAGTLETSFNIVAADIASASIAAVSNQVWTGSAITPAPVLTFSGATLLADTDYTLSYSNNVSVGTATITITGKGNFTSSTSTTFDIVARDIADASVAPISDVTYTGSAITPLPVVTYGATTLTAGSDYTLAYLDNTHAGTATVIITGIGHYRGNTSVTFNIVSADIAATNITTIPHQLYAGTVLAPTPVVTSLAGATLTMDTDYNLSYANNTYVGTATITITGIGNYTGGATTTFEIITFDDLYYSQWYCVDGWLSYVIENNLMSGYSGTSNFGPLDTITRGQVATILFRYACSQDPSLLVSYGSTTNPAAYATMTEFNDEEASAFYTAAINWAKATGIMTGDSSTGYTTVRPYDSITREDLCTMIARYVTKVDATLGATLGTVDYSGVQGISSVDSWALSGVTWCASWGIIGGVNVGGTYEMNPIDTAWRASMAKMITVTLRDVMR